MRHLYPRHGSERTVPRATLRQNLDTVPAIGHRHNLLEKLEMQKRGYPLARICEYEGPRGATVLGRRPQDPANLWPQPRFGEWSADLKDKLEAKLCRLVCDG
jgi:hypothetical protein